MGKELDYIIDHVFLPPKLPHKDDSGVEKTNALIELMLAATDVFLRDHISHLEHAEWIPCVKMMRNMLEFKNKSGRLVAQKVETALSEMSPGGMNWAFLVGQMSI